MKTVKRLLIAALIGFIIAMLSMTIAIFIAYNNAYSTGIQDHFVEIFNLPIYKIVKSGNNYSGTTIGRNMGIFSTICIFISIIIGQIIYRINRTDNN